MFVVEPARPVAVREHPRAGWFAVGTVCFGAFMGQLDASIVTMIFPALQHRFGASLAEVQWVSLGYLLALIGLVAASGRIADAAGRKLVYLYGFAVFTVASAACGLAPTLGLLILFRVVQAVGAAMLQANSVAIVVTSVPAGQMRKALGVQAAAQALGLALGPTVGGLFVATVGWQWVFWVNVPVGVVALIAGRYLLPRTRERTPLRRLDWQGLVLLLAASAALLLGLTAVSGLGLPTWAVVTLFVLAAASATAFVLRERRARFPIVDLTLLRPRAVSAGLVGALCGYLVLFGPLTLFPQVFSAQGVSEMTAGLALTALPVGFAIGALAGDRLLPSSIAARSRALVGVGTCVAAAAVLALNPTDMGWVVPGLIVLGLGLGVFIPANNASIMAAIPERSSAVGGGLVNMARGLGTAVGVAAATLSLHLAGGQMGRGASAALIALALFSVVAAVTVLGGEPRGHRIGEGAGRGK
ncbi:MFS transporter [Rhodococcus sp. D2-41]|uniref:MFS transporter n=1 Tax=Speluncibacter jeojiensis TaxID=2710754 RepID=UPI00240F034F|nr:MFS transporter [Rhodococcus sp. D2-41]MDG3009577.1 MFS transporter [Rhodococcus sp. D2-41]